MQLTLWQGALSPDAGDVTHVHVHTPPEPGSDAYPGMEDLTELAHWLSAQLQRPVVLTLTHNRTTMVSFRQSRRLVRVRLHRIFRQAQEAHMRALVKFVQGDRAAGKVLDQFVAAHGHMAGAPWPYPLRTAGRVHDLAGIFAQVNADYFHGACSARITWGAPRSARGKKSMQVGLYLHAHRLICVHPCLDQDFVPRYYVAWLVFHEMLHELFGLGELRGRRAVHPPEFAVLQSCHPDFARCKAWEHEHLPVLLTYRAPPARDHGVVKLPRKLG